MNSHAKTAVITGAGSGIGKLTAMRLLEQGWDVALLGRSIARLEAVANEASGASGTALALTCDVTDENAVEKVFAEVANAFGRIDLLFNNAGAFTMATTIDEMEPDAWRTMVDVNLTGSFLCARAAFRQMRAQDPQGGRIINNGSISSVTPRPGSAAYTATKHAITGLTKSIALDGRPFNIACGQIDIGNAATAMTSAMDKGVMQADGSKKSEALMDEGMPLMLSFTWLLCHWRPTSYR